MAYNCYLDGVLMPQTPAELKLSIKGKNSTLTLLNEGEINFLKRPGLTEITAAFCLPMFADNPPTYYLEIFEKLKTERKPTQFIMTRTTPDGKLLFDTNLKVSVEEYEIQESAENGLDVTVEVKLKQYKDYGTKTVKIETVPVSKTPAAKTTKTSAAPAGGSGGKPSAAASDKIAANDKVMIMAGAVYGGLATTRGAKVPSYVIGKWYTVSQIAAHKGDEEALIKEIYSWVATKYLQKQGTTTTTATVQSERASDTAPSATTYTIKSGDTLWAIAKKYLGDGARYTEIVNANKDVISNPNNIPIGTVLKIPK